MIFQSEEWKAVYEESKGLSDQKTRLDGNLEKTREKTKKLRRGGKWEAVSKSEEKEEEIRRELDVIADEQGKLSAKLRRSYLVHLSETADVVNAEAARIELGTSNRKDAWSKLIPAVTEEVRKVGLILPLVDEDAPHIAADVLNMLIGYPGINPLEKAISSAINVAHRKRVMSRLCDTVLAFDRIDQAQKSNFCANIREHEYNEEEARKVVAKAAAANESILARDKVIDDYLEAGFRRAAPEALTEQRIIDLFLPFSYDEATRSNRVPPDDREISASLKRLATRGVIEISKLERLAKLKG